MIRQRRDRRVLFDFIVGLAVIYGLAELVSPLAGAVPWPADVRIRCQTQRQGETYQGSGTAIDSSPAGSYVLTASHVIRGHRPGTIQVVDIAGRGHRAQLLASNPKSDLALLWSAEFITSRPRPVSSTMDRADSYWVTGWPGSQSRYVTTSGRLDPARLGGGLYSFSATCWSGQSGGGIVNSRGLLVGVVSGAETPGTTSTIGAAGASVLAFVEEVAAKYSIKLDVDSAGAYRLTGNPLRQCQDDTCRQQPQRGTAQQQTPTPEPQPAAPCKKYETQMAAVQARLAVLESTASSSPGQGGASASPGKEALAAHEIRIAALESVPACMDGLPGVDGQPGANGMDAQPIDAEKLTAGIRAALVDAESAFRLPPLTVLQVDASTGAEMDSESVYLGGKLPLRFGTTESTVVQGANGWGASKALGFAGGGLLSLPIGLYLARKILG